VYEKGKQLGDPESGHTRCELRLYGKRLNLPTDVLREPGAYFGAAYPPLRALVSGELQQLQVKAAVVNAHASGMVRALRRQSGRALGLLDAALGDKAGAFLAAEVLRPGRPQRFRGVPGNLPELVRQQLRHKDAWTCEVNGDADPQ
jgi:DNA relaxase NicK